jgi:regulator of protease activity HflC (stomatin/prohibitin superfamily)
MLERWGQFHQVVQPGMTCVVPFADRIAGCVSLRTNQLNVRIETKTLDNVFVKIAICVQYKVMAPNAKTAFCKF